MCVRAAVTRSKTFRGVGGGNQKSVDRAISKQGGEWGGANNEPFLTCLAERQKPSKDALGDNPTIRTPCLCWPTSAGGTSIP